METMTLIEIFNSRYTVVHCPTEESAAILLVKASSMGYRWSSGDPFDSYTNWYDYEHKTCYYISDGTYCSLEYFGSEVFNVISVFDIAELGLKKQLKRIKLLEDEEIQT